MKLLINLATRGRPAILFDTIKKTIANFGHPDTELMVSVDADDTPTLDALGSKGRRSFEIMLSIKKREDAIAEKWNRVLKRNGDLYMPMVDHSVRSTLGFGRLMI